MKYTLLILDLEGTLVSFCGGSASLYPGVITTLSQLREAGVMLAVATGASRARLRQVLQETGLGPLIVSSRTADDCFSKPHPQMLLELMTEFDQAPDRVLMVGDSACDLQAAQNAGIQSVLVQSKPGADAVSAQLAPMAIIERFDELLSIVAN